MTVKPQESNQKGEGLTQYKKDSSDVFSALGGCEPKGAELWEWFAKAAASASRVWFGPFTNTLCHNRKGSSVD